MKVTPINAEMHENAESRNARDDIVFKAHGRKLVL